MTIYERVYNAILEIRRSVGAVLSVAGRTGNITLTSADIEGTATNDDAAAGFIGEYVEDGPDAPAGLTNDTADNMASISLGAGDWDVFGYAGFILSGATGDQLEASFSTTSATAGSEGFVELEGFAGRDATLYVPVPTRRFKLSAPSTVYLVTKAYFTVGTASSFGKISARRVR